LKALLNITGRSSSSRYSSDKMKMFPIPTVTRFEQLKPGDLFFMELSGVRFSALKAVDADPDGHTLMVVLGPKLSDDIAPGTLMKWQGSTVISLAQNFTVLLPTEPKGWATEAPDTTILPLMLAEGELYIRAKFSAHGYGRLVSCVVKLSNGQVLYNQHFGTAAYALSWEVAIEDELGALRSVLKMGQS
jgi:hypothetical protein